MVRIAIRDICGWADLDQTMQELSELADLCTDVALACLYCEQCRRWGAPRFKDGKAQQMVVLGLGKLGACELNFSSDVDWIFAYPQDGRTQGGSRGTTSHEEFFLRLGRELIQAIGANTADGFAFRVDTRLRPYGEVGPLVLSFDKLEDYYEEQGREWERYALIKARVVAGDQQTGNTLLKRLKPFVFRRYLDYGAFDGLREMKARISLEVRNKGLKDNIKLGPGGIREIEFFGQMFQLIRGGIESALQIRPIRQVLTVLVRKRYIPDHVGSILDKAYVFLRTIENRLQQWRDQQTHQLPAAPQERFILAAAMGFDDWERFVHHLDGVRSQVHAHFNDLLAPSHSPKPSDPQLEIRKALSALWQASVDPEQSFEVLTRIGYKEPSAVIQLIVALREDRSLLSLSAAGRDRLDRLLPLVLEAVGRADMPEVVLSRVFDLIKSIQRRTAYLSLLLENPTALTHLIRLSGASPWIAAFVNSHPVLLDELLDPRTLYRPPGRVELAGELTQKLAAVDPDDLEYQMEVLRVFKQVNVLRVAASDITDVLPLMKVSDHLSDIAEIMLEAVVDLCWRDLHLKHGAPHCRLGDTPCQKGFAVIAYGKLGGLELGYGSDLDLVFLHAAQPGHTASTQRPIDNTLFFSRLGQRVLHLLTTPTAAGRLYTTDMRLRPSGDSGMLVSHVDGFGAYQRDEAWTWEHQALIRARAITGDAALRQRFEDLRAEVLTRPRRASRLRQEVVDMRCRLRGAQQKIDEGIFDIKQGPGGIVDIEFLVQYLILRHAHNHPQIIRWTDNVRLIQALNDAGILGDTTAFGLRRAYLVYRALVHRLNLKQQPARIDDDRFEAARRFVVRTWQRFLWSSD